MYCSSNFNPPYFYKEFYILREHFFVLYIVPTSTHPTFTKSFIISGRTFLSYSSNINPPFFYKAFYNIREHFFVLYILYSSNFNPPYTFTKSFIISGRTFLSYSSNINPPFFYKAFYNLREHFFVLYILYSSNINPPYFYKEVFYEMTINQSDVHALIKDLSRPI
jgi:hypothetical protein